MCVILNTFYGEFQSVLFFFFLMYGWFWSGKKLYEYCMLFSPVCPLQPLRLIVPDMVTVRQALANQFPLFPQSTSLFHTGEQSLWKKRRLTFGFIDHLRYGKKCHSVIPLTTTGIEEKPNSPQNHWPQKAFAVLVCVYSVWAPLSTSSIWTFTHHK